MLDSFKEFIETHSLFYPSDKILLGVSGGMDSMVMTELFDRCNYNYGIAHCNFKLRGSDSDEDEKLVSRIANDKGVDYFVKRFDTSSYAQNQGISVQMAARDLRFAWFEEILDEQGYEYIALAHHLDDQIETFFINLSRGTGISGLHGILPVQGKVIHPMLFTYRESIDFFARDENIEYRTDLSNLSNKYLRNKVRHDILPLFEQINPGFRSSMGKTIQRLRETEIIFKDRIQHVENDVVRKLEGKVIIDFDSLSKLEPLQTYLYALIAGFGFTGDQAAQIIESVSDQPGQLFYSETHVLLINRKTLEIAPRARFNYDESQSYLIEESGGSIAYPVELKIDKLAVKEDFTILPDLNIAYLDLDKLKYPLVIRKWREGDYFYPLGMKGRKKLSDYFIDEKFSRLEKASTWLLTSGDDLIWVIGHRIDHRYRITDKTKMILRITYIDKE